MPLSPSSTSTTPLSIAILGAGRIGSTFAFQLAYAGHHNVTVIARPGSPRLNELQRDRGIVNIKGEQAHVRIGDTLDEDTAFDLVIVTLLAFQVEAMLPVLRRSAAKCFLFMFNTFEPEMLQEAVGLERCSLGMPFVQADFTKDGKLKAIIGANGQKTVMSQTRWVDVFNAAGLPAALEPDMLLWLRCHAPICVAFESISVAGKRRGRGASWAEALVVAQGLRECTALIKGLGYPIYPKAKARLYNCPASVLAAMLWILSRVRSFRELLATGQLECCAIVDVMVVAAQRAGPAIKSARIQAMKPPNVLS